MAESKPLINLPSSANLDATIDSSPPSAPSEYGEDSSKTPVVIKTHLPSSGLDGFGTIGQYQLIEKLGEGGMGTVYKAEDTTLRRRVALKVMKPNIASEPVSRERFFREARAAAQLEHDNIVAIHQVGEENGVPFLAMPLLKGEALGTILKRNPQPQLDFILKVARDVAAGLAAAHAQGLVHRDIKPDNIWIEPGVNGGEIRAKILDFGLARPRQEDGALLTRQGAFLGTPAYVAPEQARGMEVDHRADLFSLGCVLYEMCAGRRPFNGVDSMAVLTALISEQPHEPSRLNPGTPPALSQLVMRLLEKDPTRRPESAQVVVDIAKAIQNEISAGANPVSIGRSSAVAVEEYEYRREEPRSMLPFFLAGLLILLVAVGYAIYKYKPPAGPGRLEVVAEGAAEEKYTRSGSALEIRNATTGTVVQRLLPKERKIDKIIPGKYRASIVDGDSAGLLLRNDKSLDSKFGSRSVEFEVESGGTVKLIVMLSSAPEIRAGDKEK